MHPLRSASGSVIAAAVVAILESSLIFLSSVAGFLGVLLNGAELASSAFPPFIRTFSLLVIAFFAVLSVFGIVTGIGLIRLRAWARMSILIWGGLSLFFGLFGAFIAFLTPAPGSPAMNDLPAGFDRMLRITMLVVYGLPALVGAWWLLLFNTKSIKEQFATATVGLRMYMPPGGESAAAAFKLAKVRPPIFVSILAWLYITSAAHVLIVPFLPFPLPIFLFGHFFAGAAATAIYVGVCAIVAVLGVGLLKLKPWSYDSVIGLQIFFLASNAVTFSGSGYQAPMASLFQKLMASMHLPADWVYVPDFSQFRWSLYAGLVFSAVVIALLLYYRHAFSAAVQASRTAAAQPGPAS